MKKRFNKVYIEITNACNLSCSFCGHTTRAPSFMSLTDFTQVLDRLEGHASMLLFHVMGEPMLHPHLALFLTLAGERGFAVTLTTNGTLLFDRVSQLMGKAALVRLNLSVQSLEQFPEAERVGRLNSLISAVRELVPAQQSLREKFLVSFRFWTRDDDGFSEPLLERLASAFLPDSDQKHSVTREILSGRNGYILSPGIAIHAADSFEWPVMPSSAVLQLAAGLQQEKPVGVLAGKPVGELAGKPVGTRAGKNPEVRGFCRGLRDQIGILVDGTVVPCCLDRNGDIALGNIHQETLQEILCNSRSTAIYDGFTAKRVVEPLCKGCSFRTRFS